MVPHDERERLENLDELLNAAANFTQEDEDSLTAFLTHAALESGDNQAQEGQDAVQLMTVHSAKGLEFNQVFITGLEDGLFPHENSIMEKDGLDEERRLMYVAITRARARLYLSFAQTRMLHGQTRYNMKSRFFDELPEVGLSQFAHANLGLVELASAPVKLQRARRKLSDGAAGRVYAARPEGLPRRKEVGPLELVGGQRRVQGV